jgi:tRNA pseudouridine38-40 synthase
MRYRFRCEYLGSAFYGWQEQNEAGKTKFVTVQSALEEAFSVALRAPIRIVGSGRTDTGVHARGQCVHFDFDGELDPFKTERSINGLTKRLIRIRDLQACAPDFHARYDAVSRYYQYTIFTRPVALMRDFGWECGSLSLDLGAMEREAQAFLARPDICLARGTAFGNEPFNVWKAALHDALSIPKSDEEVLGSADADVENVFVLLGGDIPFLSVRTAFV